MDDLNAIANAIVAQGRRRWAVKKVPMTCPGCCAERQMLVENWRKRKSDYCQPCAIRIRHGLKPGGESGEGTRLHNIWLRMRQRCGLIGGASDKVLKNYKGRGIKVCEEWASSFSPFKEWAETHGYADGLVIDRANNDKGYDPANCRWLTIQDSNRNKRNVKLDMEKVAIIRSRLAGGQRGIQRILAKEYGVAQAVISDIKRGKIWADR